MKTLIIGKNTSINKALGDLLKENNHHNLHFIQPEEQFTSDDIENIGNAAIIIIDLTSANNNTKLFIQQIRQLNENAIIIAMHIYHEPEFIQPIIESGASAYLLLNTNSREIELAIKNANHGKVYISPETIKEIH